MTQTLPFSHHPFPFINRLGQVDIHALLRCSSNSRHDFLKVKEHPVHWSSTCKNTNSPSLCSRQPRLSYHFQLPALLERSLRLLVNSESGRYKVRVSLEPTLDPKVQRLTTLLHYISTLSATCSSIILIHNQYICHFILWSCPDINKPDCYQDYLGIAGLTSITAFLIYLMVGW